MESKSYDDTRHYEPAKKFPQYLAALSVCLGAVAAGTFLGWTSNMSIEGLEKGDLNDIPIDRNDGWVGSFATVGAMVICFPIGWICDRIGRKWASLSTVVPFTIGYLLIIFSTTIELIYVGRFFVGMGGGAFCVAAPMYTSEIAEISIRGSLGSYFQLLLTVGILFAYGMAWAMEPLHYTIVLACIPIVFFVVFFFQPETPVYLLRKNKEPEARKALIRLRGTDKCNIDLEIKTIKQSIEEEQNLNISLKESFKKRSTKRATAVCFGLMFFQQLSGINAVIFYTGDIFEAAGTGMDTRLATTLVGIMQVAATLVSSIVVERLGRRILLLLSGFLMGVSIVVLAIFFSLKERKVISEDAATDIGFIPVISLCVFIIVFSLGYGPIPWMISSELFPAEVKSMASSAAGTFNWLLAFIITLVYKDLKESIGGDTVFYIFGCLSFLGVVFVWFVVPETKGKTLDEIQRELNREPKRVSTGIENAGYSH